MTVVVESVLICDHCGARGEPSATAHLARQQPGWGVLEYHDPNRRHREPKRTVDLCPACLGRMTEPRVVRQAEEVMSRG